MSIKFIFFDELFYLGNVLDYFQLFFMNILFSVKKDVFLVLYIIFLVVIFLYLRKLLTSFTVSFEILYFLYKIGLWPNLIFFFFPLAYVVSAVMLNLFFRNPAELKLVFEYFTLFYNFWFLYNADESSFFLLDVDCLKNLGQSQIRSDEMLVKFLTNRKTNILLGRYCLTTERQVYGLIFMNSLEENFEQNNSVLVAEKFPRFFPIYETRRQNNREIFRTSMHLRTKGDILSVYGEREFMWSVFFKHNERNRVYFDNKLAAVPVKRYLPKTFFLNKTLITKLNQDRFVDKHYKLARTRHQQAIKNNYNWRFHRILNILSEYIDNIYFGSKKTGILGRSLWWKKQTLRVRMPLNIWERNLLAIFDLPSKNYPRKGSHIMSITRRGEVLENKLALGKNHRSQRLGRRGATDSYNLYYLKTFRGLLEKKALYSRGGIYRKPIDDLPLNLEKYRHAIKVAWNIVFLLVVVPTYTHGFIFNRELWDILRWHLQISPIGGRELNAIYGVPLRPLRARFRKFMLLLSMHTNKVNVFKKLHFVKSGAQKLVGKPDQKSVTPGSKPVINKKGPGHRLPQPKEKPLVIAPLKKKSKMH